jgi:hypothetical protein
VTEKKHQKNNPHIGTGTTRIGFQIGESQNRFGVHSNLGTNIYILLTLTMRGLEEHVRVSLIFVIIVSFILLLSTVFTLANVYFISKNF